MFAIPPSVSVLTPVPADDAYQLLLPFLPAPLDDKMQLAFISSPAFRNQRKQLKAGFLSRAMSRGC